MAAPMSMKERIALFSAGKSNESTPDKASGENSVKSETPVRRSSIADKIAALKAGGGEKPQPATNSTPGKLNTSNVTVSTPNSNPDPSTSDDGTKKTSIADRIAAMKISSAEKTNDSHVKTAPNKFPIPGMTSKVEARSETNSENKSDDRSTDKTTVQQSDNKESTTAPSSTIKADDSSSNPGTGSSTGSLNIESAKATTEENLTAQPASASAATETSAPIAHTANDTISTIPVAGPKVEASQAMEVAVTEPASQTAVVAAPVVSAATEIKRENEVMSSPTKTVTISEPTATVTANPATNTPAADGTPVRRSSIADRIAALKNSGSAEKEKPTEPSSASKVPNKLPVFGKAPSLVVPEAGEGVTRAATVPEKKVNKFGNLGAMINLGSLNPNAPRPMFKPKPREEDAEEPEVAGRKRSASNTGEMTHANLSRPALSSDKRKRAVQSLRLSNVDWDQVAREEGLQRLTKSMPGTPFHTHEKAASLCDTPTITEEFSDELDGSADEYDTVHMDVSDKPAEIVLPHDAPVTLDFVSQPTTPSHQDDVESATASAQDTSKEVQETEKAEEQQEESV